MCVWVRGGLVEIYGNVKIFKSNPPTIILLQERERERERDEARRAGAASIM